MALRITSKKTSPREKRKLRTRKQVFGTAERPRLVVFRSSKHIYAQIVEDISGKTLCTISTQTTEVVTKLASDKVSSKSVPAAKAVGMAIAEASKAINVKSVVFDRNGFLYHGRIKAVADGAREGGLEF